ncbi:MAG: GC-type dockerin domain-anchored protein [Phycisphaerales bacterium JB039]
MPPFSTRRVAGAVAITAGLAATAAAQDCRLSLTADDTVLLPGETARIHAWASFPATTYAFASADFDVAADMPGWSFASSGAIAGASVLGATASQAHNPPLGVFADPANPKRIWTGTFAPDSYKPRLVPIEATPTDFWIYPSDLTASPAPCPADPGRAWIFVNPLALGGYGAAALAGTDIEIDGLTVRGTSAAGAICHGVTVLAWARVDGTTMEGLDGAGSLTIEVEPADDGKPICYLRYKLVRTHVSSYQLSADWGPADSYHFRLYRDGALLREFETTDGAAPFSLSHIPEHEKTTFETNFPMKWDNVRHIAWSDHDIEVEMPGARSIIIDTVEVEARDRSTPKLQEAVCKGKVFAATGVSTLSVTVDSPCRVDLNADGTLDFFDFLAFQNLFAAGDSAADFSSDGLLDFFDFLQFQNEFAAGCP